MKNTLEELRALWNKNELALKNNKKCTVAELNEAWDIIELNTVKSNAKGTWTYYKKRSCPSYRPECLTIKVTDFLRDYREKEEPEIKGIFISSGVRDSDHMRDSTRFSFGLDFGFPYGDVMTDGCKQSFIDQIQNYKCIPKPEKIEGIWNKTVSDHSVRMPYSRSLLDELKNYKFTPKPKKEEFKLVNGKMYEFSHCSTFAPSYERYFLHMNEFNMFCVVSLDGSILPFKYCRPIKSKLNDEQIKSVAEWLNDWGRVKGTVIVEKFIENFKK